MRITGASYACAGKDLAVAHVVLRSMRRSAPAALVAFAMAISLAAALPVADADAPAIPTTTPTTPVDPATVTAPAGAPAPAATAAPTATPTPSATATTPSPPSPATAAPAAAPAAAAAPRSESTTSRRQSHSRHHRSRAGLRARIAGDPGATISDFKFTPATLTVHVGDTVTWSNVGPSSHTATATDGSFDTGVLKKGQSTSHTFTQAGTFAYVCQIHPFMHGTVVVLTNTTSPANGSSGAGSPSTAQSSGAGASTPSTSPLASAATPSGPSLPNTGFDAAGAVLVGLILVAAGVRIRRLGS
jgi:plastocyanin